MICFISPATKIFLQVRDNQVFIQNATTDVGFPTFSCQTYVIMFILKRVEQHRAFVLAMKTRIDYKMHFLKLCTLLSIFIKAFKNQKLVTNDVRDKRKRTILIDK